MKFLSWKKQKLREQRFQPLLAEEQEEDTEEKSPVYYRETIPPRSNLWYAVVLVIGAIGVAVTSGSFGVYVGVKIAQHDDLRYIYESDAADGILEPSGPIDSHLRWNNTFQKMDMSTRPEAWATLFPDGQGFVHHPVLAPDTSTIAAYHQIHCLQSIEAFYIRTMFKIDIKRDDHHSHMYPDWDGKKFPGHIAHCFDLLRQALICAADSNLQPLVPEIYGPDVAIPRKCRDVNKLIRWAEKWKSPITHEELERRLGVIREISEKVY